MSKLIFPFVSFKNLVCLIGMPYGMPNAIFNI